MNTIKGYSCIKVFLFRKFSLTVPCASILQNLPLRYALLRYRSQGGRDGCGIGAKRNAYEILVGKPGRKIPFGRPRRRWEDSIRMGLREIGWEGVVWIQVAQDRYQWRDLVNTVMNLRTI